MTNAIIAETKSCSFCKKNLPLINFGISTGYKDGHRGQCKVCRSRLNSEYLKAHPEKKPKRNQATRRKYKTNPDVTRRSLLKGRYGLTISDYQGMLEAQGGCCAICGTNSAGGRWGTFHIDHCHDTGVVRGLLCHNCNVTLGQMGDNIDGVMRFVRYFDQTRKLNK